MWVTLAALLSASAVMMVDLGSAVAETVKRGGTMVFARPDEPLTFDPFVPNDNGSIYALEQVCDFAVEADSTGRGLRPGLAESWEISSDGLKYTFKIRDAKFSNGDPVTVDDVVFSLKSLADPNRSMSFILKPVKSIEAVDDKHVKVTLSEPYAPMLSAVSVYASGIVHKKTYEASPEKFGSAPLCAGPFAVESYVRGSKVIMVRNPHYWDIAPDGKAYPYLDKIEMLYVPESNTRVLRPEEWRL